MRKPRLADLEIALLIDMLITEINKHKGEEKTLSVLLDRECVDIVLLNTGRLLIRFYSRVAFINDKASRDKRTYINLDDHKEQMQKLVDTTWLYTSTYDVMARINRMIDYVLCHEELSSVNEHIMKGRHRVPLLSQGIVNKIHKETGYICINTIIGNTEDKTNG